MVKTNMRSNMWSSRLYKSYSDYDGTNGMFINPQMSTFPTDGKVSIRLENGTALDENNAGIWAFGYEGEVFTISTGFYCGIHNLCFRR